ncbi:MAG TPA: cysteine--tRNA ligase [Vicinamibacterales bacterium]|nr:cysteine--tRNA ligase [Vicinamibacterales bacterium]
MLRLYNTLSRQEEAFAPARNNTVRMYACGLTVYARGHIGNFRTFVCVDVLRRTLKYLCGHNVDGVMNYTDVDDKTIAGSVKAGKPLREYTEEWVNAFRSDVELLGIEMPEHTPRATDDANMQAMCDMVMALERNGHTYNRDGSIYFKIGTLPTYGRLARLDQQSLHAGASVDLDEYSKDDARDFVLWKAAKPGEPTWECAGLPGRPGWHIECSAMALRLLDGAPIDIHAGGVDLIFPHHENEIAQAEGATKQTFSRFWVHVEHLFVENEKMSKSLGNVFTVPDIVAKGFRPSALRYLLLSSHYRKQLNFTWSGMEQAEESLRRVVDFLVRLDGVTGQGKSEEIEAAAIKARDAFKAALEGDLNTAAGLAALFDLVKSGNAAIDAGKMGAEDAALVRSTIEDLDRVLGVVSLRRAEDAKPPMPVEEIERMIEGRKAAKQRRDFAEADRIRTSLADRGVLLEDNPFGTRWKKK